MIGLKELIGFEIRADDGVAGRISDFVIDERTWTVSYAVIPLGGFLSGERHYIAVDGLRLSAQERALTSSHSLFELDAMRPKDLVSKVQEGWAAVYEDAAPHTPAKNAPELQSPWRSLNAMRGGDISALDGVYGSLDDLLLEPGQWRIQYFLGRSYKWKKKPTVLIPTAWVKQVSWKGETVDVSVSKEALEREPSYKPASHAQTE
jgi:hypothetical protein